MLPRTVKILPPTEPLSVTRPAKLVCESVGSRPPATITWWRKGKFMGKAPEKVRFDLQSVYLWLTVVYYPWHDGWPNSCSFFSL